LLDTSRWGSTACWLTWKKSATPAGRWLYRLVPSTPRTGATGFGLWPTPRASESEMRTYSQTPTQKASAHGKYLQVEVLEAERKLWPTPMPSDVMGGRTTKGKDRPNETGIRLAVGGKLNPDWVGALMAYPPGWLDLED
jgi:hypothetical protein